MLWRDCAIATELVRVSSGADKAIVSLCIVSSTSELWYHQEPVDQDAFTQLKHCSPEIHRAGLGSIQKFDPPAIELV